MREFLVVDGDVFKTDINITGSIRPILDFDGWVLRVDVDVSKRDILNFGIRFVGMVRGDRAMPTFVGVVDADALFMQCSCRLHGDVFEIEVVYRSAACRENGDLPTDFEVACF